MKRYFLILILCIILFILSFPLQYLWNRKLSEGHNLFKKEDPINSRICSIKKIKTSAYILFADSSKLWIPSTKNYDYQPALFNYFIQVGDSISKATGSDTIQLFRGKEVYCFLLGKDLNSE